MSADTEGATKKRATACTRCKTRKTKCEWNGSKVCKACETSGLQAECTVVPSSRGTAQHVTRARRGHSLPPATISAKSTIATHQLQTSTVVEESDQVTMQEDLPNCAAGKKRNHSETNLDSQSITGRRQHSQARKDNLDFVLTSSSGRMAQTDMILDPIDESDEDQIDDAVSSQEGDYRQFRKAAIVTSLGGGAGSFSNDSDSSDNSDSDMEIVSNPAPKQRQRPQGKMSAQRKPSSRKKIKTGDDSDEESDTSDSDPATCGV